jgi:hypothetical protein
MMSSSNNAKFQMTEGDSVNVSIVGSSEHAQGSFSSQTSGSVEMNGSMSGSATYSGSGLTGGRVTMSASFTGGGSTSENFGGGFVNSIVDAGGGGGDSRYAAAVPTCRSPSRMKTVRKTKRLPRLVRPTKVLLTVSTSCSSVISSVPDRRPLPRPEHGRLELIIPKRF